MRDFVILLLNNLALMVGCYLLFGRLDLDAIAKGVAARLSDEPVKLDDSEMDALAAKFAEAWNALPDDESDDDALAAKIADAVRDRINEVNVSATDLDRFAVRVTELADQRRAERERAKAKQASKEGKYKRDDLVDVLDGDQWVPGWYVNFFKSHDGDLFPHHVAFIGGFNSDGEADIDDAYKPDYEVRRRRPAEVATTA